MEVYAVSGKGGVGKTTISSGIASALSKRDYTLIVDCDKRGRAIERTFFPEGSSLDISQRETVFPIVEMLYGGTIPEYKFSSLLRADKKQSAKLRTIEFGKYMAQFPGDYGIAALQDMMSTFFGVNTNPESILSFITLSNILLDTSFIENIVLDLEPTQGTSRLLNNASNTSRILRNMSQYGFATLTAISAKFPDITRFLRSDYIKNADEYGRRIEQSSKKISEANYILVCGPEPAKVDEMLHDTEPIIESFGGRVCAYVINDIRRNKRKNTLEERCMEDQISKVKKVAKEKGIPAIEVAHDSTLCINDVTNENRRIKLRIIGEQILKNLNL